MAKNLIISKELNNFVIKDVKPTGNVLGHGSFGVVNEVYLCFPYSLHYVSMYGFSLTLFEGAAFLAVNTSLILY